MLMQSGAYFFGSIALRYIAPALSDRRCTVLGLCFPGSSSVLIALRYDAAIIASPGRWHSGRNTVLTSASWDKWW